MKDVTSLASDISLNTSRQKSADLESGRCVKGDGIGFVSVEELRARDIIWTSDEKNLPIER